MKPSKLESDIFDAALRVYGHDAQIMMAIEEMSELTSELIHHIRGRAEITDIQGEIADVLNAAEQLKKMFGSEKIELIRQQKLIRLSERISNNVTTS